jgi:hypothetical protein
MHTSTLSASTYCGYGWRLRQTVINEYGRRAPLYLAHVRNALKSKPKTDIGRQARRYQS